MSLLIVFICFTAVGFLALCFLGLCRDGRSQRSSVVSRLQNPQKSEEDAEVTERKVTSIRDFQDARARTQPSADPHGQARFKFLSEL